MVMAGAVMASIARRVSPSHQCHQGQLEPKKKLLMDRYMMAVYPAGCWVFFARTKQMDRNFGSDALSCSL